MAEAEQTNLTALTVQLLSAYVSKNSIPDGDLAALIQSTHSALKVIDAPTPVEPPAPEHVPAVSVRKSLGSPKHILSLIDGKPYQTLKRHLSRHGLTPAEYRERYGLPRNYPMVAPAYSEQRRGIAQRLGLGQKVKGGAAAPTPTPEQGETIAATATPGKPSRAASKRAVVAQTPAAAKDADPAPATPKPARAAVKRATKAAAIAPATTPAVEPATKKPSAKEAVSKSTPKAAKARPGRKAGTARKSDATPVPQAAAEAKPPRASRARKTSTPEEAGA